MPKKEKPKKKYGRKRRQCNDRRNLFRQNSEHDAYDAERGVRKRQEIVAAEKKGERLISTELADKVGVTRSAISQMVNRLSAKGYVKRVPDDVDRKIAYIVMDGKGKELYLAQRKKMGEVVNKVINDFGADKANQMIKLVEEFSDSVYRNVR